MLNKTIDFVQSKKNAYAMLSVIVLFQVIVLGCFFMFSRGTLYLQDDTSGYTIPAQSFLEQGKMLSDEEHAMIFRTPGYPLFLAAVYGIGGGNGATAVIQCILVVFISLLVYNGIVQLTGLRISGIMGMVLYSLEFSHYTYAVCILPDILFSFLICLSVWSVISGIRKKRMTGICVGAVCINMALLVKPTLMYMNMLLCLVVELAVLLRKLDWKAGVCYLLAFLCLFGGWSFRNSRETGYFIFSNIRYVQFFRWDGPELMSDIEGIELEESILLFHQELEQRYGIPYSDADLSDMEIAEKERIIGNEYVFSHVKEYIIMNIEGLFHLLFRADGKYFEEVFHSEIVRKLFSSVTVMVLAAIYVLYAVGFLRYMKKQKAVDWCMLLLCMYLMAGTASLGTSRYRFAFLPLVIVGMAISWRHHKLLDRKGKSLNRRRGNQ